MNYCQFRNDFIKRMANAGGATPILPPEYQQVEYLQSSGTQYINTGINAASGDIIDVTIHFIGLNIANKAIMGSQKDNSGNNRTAVIFGYNGNANYVSIASGNVSASASATKFYARDYSEALFRIDDQAKMITGTCNGVALTSQAYGGNLCTSSILLFNNNRANITEQISSASLYYFKCIINGSVIRELVPCYRKSDNKPGMYDLVTNTFFTNAGTGEFTVGNDVL